MEALVEASVRRMNMSQRRMIVVLVLAVLLFVVTGLVVSATQRAGTQGERSRPSTGSVPTSVAVLPGLAAAGVAAVAIVANNWQERTRQEHERKLARDRQEHERELKREELEDQWQSRLRDERIRVYTEFGTRWTWYEHARNRGDDSRKLDEAHTEFMRSFNALSLIAPEEVREHAAAMLDRSTQRKQQGKAPGLFWKAAREDLGIPL
jgi:hypothetical protein